MSRIFRWRIGGGQRGFTLLELMVSVGIMGALGGVVATSSFAMLQAQDSTNSHAQVAIEVSKSTRWLARDIHRAASSDVVDSAPAVSNAGFTWSESGTITTCTYSVDGLSNTLLRSCPGVTQVVSRGISGLEFTRSGDLVTASYTVTSETNSSYAEIVELSILLGGG